VRPPCTVPGCDRPNDARGLCHLHYGRVRRAERAVEKPPAEPPAKVIDSAVELFGQGEHPLYVAARLGVSHDSLVRAAERAELNDLARWIRTGEPMRPPRSAHHKFTADERQERAHSALLHDPAYEDRECRDDPHTWDGPGDGELAEVWWKRAGEFAATLCRACPVFEPCSAWRRTRPDVTGVLAGDPVDQGRPVDVRPRSQRRGAAA
jgi:hypothetical protein